MLRFVQILSIVLVAMAMAPALAHALELILCDGAGRDLCDVDGFRHEKKFSGAPRV
jgi:hypothetical protein